MTAPHALAWHRYVEAVNRRDAAAKAAHAAQWQRFAPKVEEARAAYMQALSAFRADL